MDTGGFHNAAYAESLQGSTTSIPGIYRPGNETIHQQVPPPRTTHLSVPLELSCKASEETKQQKQHENWGGDLEFLMSCIALSVGLGNVWRFPFTALDNGGGAFVIPYLIVLILVGRPVYYMEMLLGQFSSRGCVKVFDLSPVLRGVGYGQVFGTAIVSTYYATLMALTLRYFVDSFYPTLPWSYCLPEWGDGCMDSKTRIENSTQQHETSHNGTGQTLIKKTSAEFYFTKVILREKDSIDDGIGYPSWSLSITLAFSWILIGLIIVKGVKSSGKAAYFLALFPYFIMLILLVRSVTLPGAFDGVIYFLKPQWDQLLVPKVWYAAVTQVFFSLAVCFGNIIMYASFNRFGHNIHRDAKIVTTLDTFTSLLSGVIIFGILGNLAYESNTTDIRSVVKGGTGLAFISYPDAIAKFKFVPQIFSVLFFLMLYVLGIGSNVGMASCVVSLFTDRFTKVKHWVIVLCVGIVGYCIGLIYITPGGQYLLNFLDFHGASFVALTLAIFELIGVGWIYGVKRFCKDIKFMLGVETSLYYRICWGVITPGFMAAILIYTLVEYEPITYNGYVYPNGIYVFGWCLSAFGIGQLLIWAIYEVKKQNSNSLWERVINTFKPLPDWGPRDLATLKEYQHCLKTSNEHKIFQRRGLFYKIYDNIFG